MGEFDAPAEVEKLLRLANGAGASDLHVEPDASGGHEARMRVDGVLTPAVTFSSPGGQMVVARLMVLGKLLTYRTDVPQEGRCQWNGLDLRISVMPTAKGLRLAVRLPAMGASALGLEKLGLSPGVLAGLASYVSGRAGMLIVTGPAGSGKTTLSYALLEAIRDASAGTSIVTLEDPVERMMAGVTQIEVTPFGQLTYERALRSMLRQDPQVLLLGEIRDPATAQLAAQAAMSGHRLVCTLHAGDPATALRRMMDMGVEPYQLTSALHGVIALRLVRRITSKGYGGRIPLAEWLPATAALRSAMLANADADALRAAYENLPRHVTLRRAAMCAVAEGATDNAEIARVFGA